MATLSFFYIGKEQLTKHYCCSSFSFSQHWFLPLPISLKLTCGFYFFFSRLMQHDVLTVGIFNVTPITVTARLTSLLKWLWLAFDILFSWEEHCVLNTEQGGLIQGLFSWYQNPTFLIVNLWILTVLTKPVVAFWYLERMCSGQTRQGEPPPNKHHFSSYLFSHTFSRHCEY